MQNRPNEADEDRRRLIVINQKIQGLLDQIEDGSGFDDLRERLQARQNERDILQHQIADREQRCQRPVESPTAAWLEVRIGNLAAVLKDEGPAASAALRDLIGSIVVSEVKVPGKKRKTLVGRFELHIEGIARVFGISNEVLKSTMPQREYEVSFAPRPGWLHYVDRVTGIWKRP
jgi:hypothetical protein